MTKTEMSLWSNFRHWLHRKLSFWQVPVQLGISAKLPFPWTCFYHVYYFCDVKTPKLLDKFVIFCTTKKLIFHQSAVLSTFQIHPTTINFYYHDLHVNTFMYTFWDWMCWPVLNKDCNIVTPDHMPCHDDVMKWKHFPRYWQFVRGIHRWPVNSSHKGQWLGALMFFYLRLNKRMGKQSWGWCFET